MSGEVMGINFFAKGGKYPKSEGGLDMGGETERLLLLPLLRGEGPFFDGGFASRKEATVSGFGDRGIFGRLHRTIFLG